MMCMWIMVSMCVSVKHSTCWNICNIWRVILASVVGRAWTETLDPRAQQPPVRVNQNVRSSVNKNRIFFCIPTVVHWHFALANHCSSCCFSVITLPDNYFFIHSDHTRLHFNNIRQCKLTIKVWSGVFMMALSKGNISRVTGHLCGEFTSHRWIPRTKTSDAEL